MGKKYAANWEGSEAAKKTKPGFNGQDTRIMHGGKAPIGGVYGKSKAPGISIRGN
jgi:hypothetical protein